MLVASVTPAASVTSVASVTPVASVTFVASVVLPGSVGSVGAGSAVVSGGSSSQWANSLLTAVDGYDDSVNCVPPLGLSNQPRKR